MSCNKALILTLGILICIWNPICARPYPQNQQNPQNPQRPQTRPPSQQNPQGTRRTTTTTPSPDLQAAADEFVKTYLDLFNTYMGNNKEVSQLAANALVASNQMGQMLTAGTP